MDAPKPIRDGWVTGPLAEAPACPPFPAFTEFERRALDSTTPLFGENAKAFREQVATAEVVDRINTSVGFYTRVKVDRAKCSPVPLRQQGAHFEVEGLEHGLGIVLWDTDGDGFLETIEGYTVDESPLESVDLAKLKFVRLTQLG
ncbi:MAG: hypothetical protein ABL957_16745 [Parvularculaceae bacterium]